MTNLLSCIEINPQTPPIGSVIWLHGLGADGNDFVSLVPELRLPAHLPLRFVFPNAPSIPVTLNNRFVMPAWYDIFSLATEAHADHAGIDVSVKKICALIEREKSLGIPADKIILAGFSQGAVIALTTGLTCFERLAGVIALSGYLPNKELLMQHASTANQSLPIFLGHGTDDAIVPFSLGESVFQLLQKNQYPVEWHTFRMAHSVCANEIIAISTFIQKIFSSQINN